jgi:hypothetical protein
MNGAVDVGDDSSFDFVAAGTGFSTLRVPALVPPTGLAVRTRTNAHTGVGVTSSNNAFALEVVVEPVLTAALTGYEPACGLGLTVVPTVQPGIEVGLSGLPSSGIGLLLISVQRTHQLLPCGGCTLAVQPPFCALLLGSASGGMVTRRFPVAGAVLPLSMDLQAVGLDLSMPCAISSSNAIGARLCR